MKGFLHNALAVCSLICVGLHAETYLTIPPQMPSPTLDGKLETHEWDLGCRQFGLISKQSGKLALRHADLLIGADGQHFYVAHRTWHPTHLKAKETGDVTLLFRTPNGEVFSFQFNSEGNTASNGCRTVCACETQCWTSETVIPASVLGQDQIADGSKWGFQLLRNFDSPREVTRFATEEFATVLIRKGVPLVNFEGMGARFPNSVGYKIPWTVRNPGDQPIEIRLESSITSIENPYMIDRRATIPPGGQTVFMYNEGIMIAGIERTLSVRVFDADKNLLQKRDFTWDASLGARWRKPVDEKPRLDFAVHPTRNKIKARVSGGNPKRFQQIQSVQFRICDNGQGVIEQREAILNAQGEWWLDWSLPKLDKGKYRLEAQVCHKDGQNVLLSRPFEMASFDWEHNEIGLEKIVIPPFKPIREQGKEILFLQTGYRRAGVLFDAVYAQGENILAAPIRLLIDGEEFQFKSDTPLKQSDAFTAHRVVASHGDLELALLQEYDVDGFCKLTMTFTPRCPVNISKMTLDIPLKGEIARMFHAVGSTMRANPSGFLPLQQGTVWESIKGFSTRPNGFRPYVWFGDTHQGMAWCAESPQGWSRLANVSSQEIVREGNAAILRIHLFNQPCLRQTPFEIVMGMQPTPVKPRPPHFRKWTGHLWGWQEWKELVKRNIMHYHISGPRLLTTNQYSNGLFRPIDGDYSYIDYIASLKWQSKSDVEIAARKYIAKHGIAEPQQGDSLMYSATSGAELLRNFNAPFAYFNPRAMHPKWPEHSMYADEFFLGEWRPPENLPIDYQCIPTTPYIELHLWAERELLRHVPKFTGIYYDNVNDLPVSDPELRNTPPEENRPFMTYWNIFGMRELMRRTATMLAQEGKLLEGYPALTLHITNANIVPINSFACATLDWENYFGNMFYQDRYPEHYVLTQTLGLQCGTIPMVIVQASGDDVESRVASLLAVAFAYDLMNFTEAVGLPKPDFFKQALTRLYRFGYGLPDTVVIPAWEKGCPVTAAPSSVRTTWVRRADGKVLILVGNLGDACTATIDFQRAGIKYATIRDAETQKNLGQGTSCQLALPRYGYAMLELLP